MVYGFASHSGSNSTNDTVSKKRAEVVSRYLKGMVAKTLGVGVAVAIDQDYFGEATAAGPDDGKGDVNEQRVDFAVRVK